MSSVLHVLLQRNSVKWLSQLCYTTSSNGLTSSGLHSFSVALSSYCIIFMLQFFRVALFSCFAIFMLHFFPITLFLLLFPRVALFSCRFFMLHSFRVVLSSCCTLFMLHFLRVPLFSCCTVRLEFFDNRFSGGNLGGFTFLSCAIL